MFASFYALAHVRQILDSGHSMGRKAVLMFESLYNLITLIFAWFGIGNFFVMFVSTLPHKDPEYTLTISEGHPIVVT